MPKLYEYFGLIIMFYANEHEPVHVHGKFQDRESRAEIIVVNGEITEIRYTNVAGRSPLENTEMLNLGAGGLMYYSEPMEMKAPVSKSTDPDLQKVPQALLRAAESARKLAEQTVTKFVVRRAVAADTSVKQNNVKCKA